MNLRFMIWRYGARPADLPSFSNWALWWLDSGKVLLRVLPAGFLLHLSSSRLEERAAMPTIIF